MMRKKVSKFYDGRRLVVGVKTSDPEEAKIAANEIFKIRKDDLAVCYARIKGNKMLYDCKKSDANAMAVYRKEIMI